VEWKPGDLVVTTAAEMAHYDGGMAVMLAAGAIGRLVTDIDGGFFGSWLVNFNGNNYWVKSKFLKKVEVLDVLADL